jgi:hypothetical protein
MSDDHRSAAPDERTSSDRADQRMTPKRLQDRRAHQDGFSLSQDETASSFARRLDLFLEGIFQQFQQRLDDLLSGQAHHQTPRYADAKNNPLGKARAFLDAGRRGEFPTFKRSREVVARWSDVEKYIERRGKPTRQAPTLDDDLELLRKAGVPVLNGSGGTAMPPSVGREDIPDDLRNHASAPRSAS